MQIAACLSPAVSETWALYLHQHISDRPHYFFNSIQIYCETEDMVYSRNSYFHYQMRLRITFSINHYFIWMSKNTGKCPSHFPRWHLRMSCSCCTNIPLKISNLHANKTTKLIKITLGSRNQRVWNFVNNKMIKTFFTQINNINNTLILLKM